MQKKFGDLKLGERFYLPLEKGGLDIRFQFMKTPAVDLTTPPPWDSKFKATPNVIKGYKTAGGIKYGFNSIIIASPEGTAGFYDYVPDDLMVFPENLTC